jgi:hypothetical protein
MGMADDQRYAVHIDSVDNLDVSKPLAVARG